MFFFKKQGGDCFQGPVRKLEIPVEQQYSPLCGFHRCSSLTSLLTGKVKQEPSVYRDGPPYQRRGSLQLWQFLVTLLDDPANGHFIAWTGRGMEFKLIEPEEVSVHKETFVFYPDMI